MGRGKTTVSIEGRLDGELVGDEDFRFRTNKEKRLSLSDEILDQVDERVVTSKSGVVSDDMALPV